MDAYKTPESDLSTNERLPFKPVKAVLYGLSISIILGVIVSSIILVIFGAMIGADITNEETLNALYSENIFFMLFDLVVSTGVFYFSGMTVGKHTAGKEIKFAVIVSVLTLMLALITFFLTDSFSLYPIWYLILSFASIPFGIYFGAKSKINS